MSPQHESVKSNLKLALGIGALLAAFGLVGRADFEEEKRLEALREERAASLAAGFCLPRPGQETRWVWKDNEGRTIAAATPRQPLPDREQLRLHCAIYDNVGYARASNMVLTAAPAGLDRLAFFQGERK